MSSKLDSIPQSKRAFFVQKKTQYPSGFGRSMPMHYEEPLYFVMRRPVDWNGNRSSFYGNGKTQRYAGPFVGAEGKAKAEEIAAERNESFHNFF